MTTCTLRMRFEPGVCDEALQVLRSLVGPVRSQPGCAQTLLMSDIQNDTVITWVSRWRSRGELDRHLQSNHFRRILAVMELASEPPELVFDSGTDSRSFDLVEEVLAGGARQPLPIIETPDNPIEGGIDR